MEVFPVRTGPMVRADFSQRFAAGTHEGTDIFAPKGAPVQAVATGRVRHAEESKGGKAVYLVEQDGTQYYYAHLDDWMDPMPPNRTRPVTAGDLIGYVGATGNAVGKQPHIHFEVRPLGGEKVDPFPFLTGVAGRELVLSPQKPAKNGGVRGPQLSNPIDSSKANRNIAPFVVLVLVYLASRKKSFG